MKSLLRSTPRCSILAAGALALACAAAAAPSALAQTMGSAPMHAMHHAPSLHLAAHGEVRVAPDMATIMTGVQTEAPTAEQAMADNRARMNRVIAALRQRGVAERDIQTSGLNLNPVYDYRENQPPLLRGYQASNTVTVIVRDLARVGQVADAVVASGANQINGISFGLDNRQAAEDQARVAAVRALQAKAQLYAQALGRPLGALRTLSEGVSYTPTPPMPMYRMEAVANVAADNTPVAPGELQVRINIEGVYDLPQ
ncbi:SIMPL domain-containing protein [Brevundimonas sp. 2R-24]|uniref:SIMPL domain-containing protein n=1 Tax=Peiella sedimenti TaxID=3061083 RepID=A0ABT8SM77_9CAUL|nr:SIMPL domain-containing protein [Caulobacteraceae bacterium XZ-24]